MGSVTTRRRALRVGVLDPVRAQLEGLESSPMGTLPGTAALLLDRDLRVLCMAGPAWDELGIDRARLAGRPLTETVDVATLAPLAIQLHAVLAGETRSFAQPVGRDRLHWVTARPVAGADGTIEGILAVSWDQTESRRAEELYRVLAENSTDAVTRHDLEGNYLYASPSIEAIVGWRPEELMGRSCFEMLHPDDIDGIREGLTRAITEGVLVTMRSRFRHRDGHYVWIESTGRGHIDTGGHGSPELQCSSRDISARVRNQEELARRLAQQSAVARLGELALQRTDLGALQHAACGLVAETLAVDLVISLEHRAGTQMVVRAGYGWPDGMVGSEIEVSSFGGAAPGDRYAGGAVVVDDLRSDTTLRGRPLRANGVVSCATVLVGEREAPAGLLGAYTRSRRSFSPEDVDFLHAVAHIIAGAIERVRVEERIRHDALHDALTGLPNRTLLLDRLRIALARAARDGSRVALLFLDLDRLKVLNDSLGHTAGDELLRAVGPRLQQVLRPADTVARFGGDEFAVLIESAASECDALRVAERIVRAFEEPFEIGGEPRFGTASVGVVVTDPALPREADELISDADAAMYRAKERGRGRYELFDAGLRARITQRLRLEQDLRRALDGEGRLWVAYQPYWSLPERRIAGVEALLRWDHPEHGAISPVDFIPVAEESGLIVELGGRVLREACAEVARLRASTPASSLALTVNVSARQVAAPDIVDTVAEVLEGTGLPPAALGLEITEGLLLEETPATVQTIQALQALGVPLILDDFGTGYSSLRYLQRYPLDGLKIDRAFVAALGEDGEGDGTIVEAMVGMARALGMRVVPEGVETEAQLARVEALGCDFAQGFHLSRPLPPDELEAWLRDGPRPGR